MSDKSVPAIVKFLDLQDLRQLPVGGPKDLYPRRNKSRDYVKNILKLADAVEGRPWEMHRAAAELRLWVQGKHAKHDLLDISFVQECLTRQRPPQSRRHSDFFVDSMAGRRAVGLEPSMAVISVSRTRSGAGETAPSMEAEFIYSVAAELVSQHGFTWQNAISVGEQSWARFPKSHKLAIKKSKDIEVVDEADEPILALADRVEL